MRCQNRSRLSRISRLHNSFVQKKLRRVLLEQLQRLSEPSLAVQRILVAMNSVCHQLLAVATSLVLALPPGSCGVFRHQEQAEPAPVKVSCCHTTVPGHPCDSSQSPSRPSVKCCCTYDATLPEKSAPPTNSVASAFIVAVDSRPLNVGRQNITATDFAPLPSGPPLQILLCVWRC